MYQIGTLVTCKGEVGVYEIIEIWHRKGKPALYKLRNEIMNEEIWEVEEDMLQLAK